MKKKFFIGLGLALELAVSPAFVCAEVVDPEIAAGRLAVRYEEQYPFPVNASLDLSKILLKSRIGRRFILAIMDRSGRVEQFDDSTQTQLAITWNPSGTGVAWLEPVKDGCGFQFKFFNVNSKQTTLFKELQVNTAASPLRFSPGGRYVALVVGSNLTVLDLEKNNAQPQIWFNGVSGVSDFIWVSEDEILTSPNDGSGALHLVSFSKRNRFSVFGQESQIKNLAWSKTHKTLLGSVRQPHQEYDSIFTIKNISTDSKNTVKVGMVSDEKKANAIRPQWIGDSHDFVYIAQEADVQNIKLRRANEAQSVEIHSILGELDIFGITNQKIMILRSATDTQPRLGTLDLKSKKSNAHASFSVIEISGQRKLKDGIGPRLTTIQARDNSPVYVQHWISSRVKGRPASAVVWIHGGPNLRESVKWNAETQEIVSHGIDFVQVNYRGSTGYGRKFEMFGSDASRLDDVEATLNYLKRDYNIPASRIILMGSSYGGYLAAHFTKDRPTDLRGLVLLSPGSFNPQSGLGDNRGPRQKWRANFPVYVYQGLHDCIITPSLGLKTLEDIFGAGFVKGLSNPLSNRLTVFPDEGHHFHRTSSRAVVWSRVLEEMTHE